MYIGLNNMINKFDINDRYRVLNCQTEGFIFFPNIYEIKKKINNMLYHKLVLNIFQGIEIIFKMLSDHGKIKK